MKCASPMVLLEFQCPTTQVWAHSFFHVVFSSNLLVSFFVFSRFKCFPAAKTQPLPVYIALWEKNIHRWDSQKVMTQFWLLWVYFVLRLFPVWMHYKYKICSELVCTVGFGLNYCLCVLLSITRVLEIVYLGNQFLSWASFCTQNHIQWILSLHSM